MADKRIEIGAIASAHGIKGQFKVKAFCEDPMSLSAYGPLFLDDGTSLSLKAHSQAKGFVLCSAKEVTTRNHAESLRGQLLYISREAMPQIAQDEIYHADLLGYQLYARGRDAVGEIVGIYDFGAGTVLEIKRASSQASGKLIMVPFGDAYGPEIDDSAQVLIMDVAAEWLDDGKDNKDTP